MNSNKKLSSSPHLFTNKNNNQNNSNAELSKNRPISALLSLKILQRQNLNKSLLQLSCKRDISFEEIQRHKQNFNKLYVLPELEAQNQSNLQYINDLYSFYDTIINEKKEEFLPFYIISPNKSEIIQKFICLNRKTKTNNLDHEVLREKKKKQIIKAKIPVKLFPIQHNETDKSDMELIDLLKKEEEINKNNFNAIFLTQKENPHNFTRQKIANEKKSNESNLKTFKTVNMNDINLDNSLIQTQKSDKINYFQNHLKEIKSKTSSSLHCKTKNEFINFKTQIFENIKMQKKNFNFSKPNKIITELEPRKKLITRLDFQKKDTIFYQNPQEKQQTSRRTENLQGWNENIILDDENF